MLIICLLVLVIIPIFLPGFALINSIVFPNGALVENIFGSEPFFVDVKSFNSFSYFFF